MVVNNQNQELTFPRPRWREEEMAVIPFNFPSVDGETTRTITGLVYAEDPDEKANPVIRVALRFPDPDSKSFALDSLFQFKETETGNNEIRWIQEVNSDFTSDKDVQARGIIVTLHKSGRLAARRQSRLIRCSHRNNILRNYLATGRL